jgi:hypothetical protein
MFISIAPSLFIPRDINIARKVLLLIEPSNNPLSKNNNVLSNNTYIKEGILKLNNLEVRLA